MENEPAPGKKGERPSPPDIRHIEIQGVLTSVAREPLETDDFYETRCVHAGIAGARAAHSLRATQEDDADAASRDDVLKSAYAAKIGAVY